MTGDPRQTHVMEQFTALVLDIAQAVGGYYETLVEKGVPEEKAWEAAQDIQERIFRGEFDEAEDFVERLREAERDDP